MRLTVRTDLAMRTLMHCATRRPDRLRTIDVARACDASFHHVAQVVNQLESAGFLTTTRGRGGGIALAREAGQIGVGQIFRLFEADLPFTECLDAGRNACPLSAGCGLTGMMCEALNAFYATLDRYTLLDLTADNPELARIFAPPQPFGAAPPT